MMALGEQYILEMLVVAQWKSLSSRLPFGVETGCKKWYRLFCMGMEHGLVHLRKYLM